MNHQVALKKCWNFTVSMLQIQYFIRAAVTSMCLFALKSAMITPVTWNNCCICLHLTKVQFLLRDAWSWTASLTAACKFLFFWWGKGKTGAVQDDSAGNCLPSPSLFPSGMKQQLWCKEEMNCYFPSMKRHKMLMQICWWAASHCRSQSRPKETSPFPEKVSQGHWTLQADESCWTGNHQ